MNNIDNLKSYDDVENLDRFSETSLEQYIDMKIKSAENDAHFIIDHIADEMNCDKLLACEIGAGNGKLMYLLEKMGRLEKGINYEVSTSRYNFAQVMKKRIGSKLVENYNENILQVTDNNLYDCIVAVDIVTQFITCLYDEAEDEYFKWINNHLKLGGYAFFEMESYKKERKIISETGEDVKRWEEFPPDDPFQYGLYSIGLDNDKNIVYKKLFYERATGKMEGFTDIIKPYDEDVFIDLLDQYGMEGKIFYWYRKPGDLPQKLYLCLAKKVREL